MHREEICSLQPLVTKKDHVLFSVLDWRWTKGKRQMDNYFNVLNAFIDKKDSYYSIHQIGKRLGAEEMGMYSLWVSHECRTFFCACFISLANKKPQQNKKTKPPSNKTRVSGSSCCVFSDVMSNYHSLVRVMVNFPSWLHKGHQVCSMVEFSITLHIPGSLRWEEYTWLLSLPGLSNMKRLLGEKILRSGKWTKEGAHFVETSLGFKQRRAASDFSIGC